MTNVQARSPGYHIRHIFLWTVCFLLFVTLSCQPIPPLHDGQPIALQIMHSDPQLKTANFRLLLDFESESDLAFIAAESPVCLDKHQAHTGYSSMMLPAGTAGFNIKILEFFNEFPASWTLVGGYLYSPAEQPIALSYQSQGKVLVQRSITLPAGQWTAGFLDVSSLSDPNTQALPPGRFCLARAAVQLPLWFDDLLVQNNSCVLLEAVTAADSWTVRHRGYQFLLEHPGVFNLSVPDDEGHPEGWALAEVNQLRARFVSQRRKQTWTIYSDGRQYCNGTFVASNSDDPNNAAYAEQQATPSDILIDEASGRIERNAPGDRNNDGYAELDGAYEVLVYDKLSFSLTIKPRTSILANPVLEIARVPAGKVSINMEGQLLDQMVRLPDGHLLVQIPATLQRPTTLMFRVQ